MIENVKGIKIKGRCFNAETNLVLFPNANDRISIIYGKNGSGKSTISECLSAIANNTFPTDLTASLLNAENRTITLSEDSKLFVFNEKYIDENVKIDDDGLGTIILLGGQVNVQDEIDKKLSEVATLETEREVLQIEYDKYLAHKNPLSPQYHWSRISTILKQSGGWADLWTDSENLYLRFDLNNYFIEKNKQIHEYNAIHIYLKSYNKTTEIASPSRAINKYGNVFPVLLDGYTHEIKIPLTCSKKYPLQYSNAIEDGLWQMRWEHNIEYANDEIFEIKIPYSDLGFESGESFSFFCLSSYGGVAEEVYPKDIPLTLTRP